MLSSKLEPFQEWPQLLDPHLASFLPQIVHAFLESLRSPTSQHITRVANDTFGKSRTVPISRAICQLLYTLCKIRGEKVISQFLSNEPKYLEPLLSAFEAWDIEGEIQEEASEKQDGPMTWFKKYIILLWLSHLLLAPFDLASISSDGSSEDTKPDIPGLAVPPGLPGIARRLLPICFKHIVSASKERDSTRTLLVRLSLRPDMRRLGLVQSLMHWASSTLESQPADGRWASIYQHVGVLSFVAGVLVSADKEVVGPFLLPVFQLWQRILLEEKSLFENIRSSALARKILIKIAQSVTVLILQPGMSRHVPEDNVSQILEDVIDHLLKALADKDTPVRYAASKALSVIATALEPEMAAEVVEAVLGSMKEDLLWEHEPRGVSLTDFELNMIEARSLKPSYSAVNPLRWHGLTLTLAHLLFRRSPAPEQLPEVLNALILALAFEQRSSTSSSVGTNVRDSACFGIWSLARRYSTAELSPVDSSAIHANNSSSKLMSVLQVLAIELVVAGSLDPSGNIRRGSSAALQELIGRHPDTIIEGISIVQVVDYHAVALRSRAATEVAIDASKLGDCYWEATLIGLLGWRGIGSPDAESRRLASRSIGLLSLVRSSSRVCKMIDNILKQLLNKRLPVVEERHGLLLSLAEIMNHTRQATCTASSMELGNQAVISSIWMLFNNGSLMSTKNFVSAALRPELTAEAACHLISAMAQWTHHQSNDGPSEADLDACISVLSLCLHRGEEVVISSTASAASDLFPILTPPKQAALVRSWVICLDRDAKGRQLGAERELGHIAALGAVFSQFSAKSRTNGLAPEQDLIVDSLVAHITLSFSVEAKVAALDSVAAGPMVSKGMCISPALGFC